MKSIFKKSFVQTSLISSHLLIGFLQDSIPQICLPKIILFYEFHHVQTIGRIENVHIPHVFPKLSLIIPSSPHAVPQLFIAVIHLIVHATNTTAWLIFVPQLLKIPDLQNAQFVASAPTNIGCWPRAVSISKQVTEELWQVVITDEPFCLWQGCYEPIYGYYCQVEIPYFFMKSKELQGLPLQPQLPYERLQSMSCWADRSCMGFPATSRALSTTETDGKAHDEPQVPWRVREALPAAHQSISFGNGFNEVILNYQVFQTFLIGFLIFKFERYRLANSSCVKSAN